MNFLQKSCVRARIGGVSAVDRGDEMIAEIGPIGEQRGSSDARRAINERDIRNKDVRDRSERRITELPESDGAGRSGPSAVLVRNDGSESNWLSDN